MDIYQLKTFVTVAAEGSITKASELPSEQQKLLGLKDRESFRLSYLTIT